MRKFLMILWLLPTSLAFGTDIFLMPTVVLTVEQKQAAIKARIIASNNAMFEQARETFSYYHHQIWDNTQGLTPQQVVDGFGTDAGTLVTKLAGLKTFLNTLRPGSITLTPPKAITVNQDGTAKVAE